MMSGVAYRRSAQMAEALGPYAGYARNAGAHQRVVRKHQAADDDLRTHYAMDTAIHRAAAEEWQQAVRRGAEAGYRNAQVSLLSPTGTTGSMLGCATTGA